MEESLWSLIQRTVTHAGSIERGVLIVLAVMSLASWCIILMKIVALHQARKNGERFTDAFAASDNFGSVQNQSHNFGASPQLEVFKSALDAMDARGRSEATNGDPRKVSIRPAVSQGNMVLISMQHTAKSEFLSLHSGLNFLATIGSTTPFIGLFGTVWGIMDTFRALGDAKSASLAVVAPGISNALIATAAGLAVAIPAVMAYNWFLKSIDDMQESTDCFIERMHAVIEASGWSQSFGAPPARSTTVQPTRPVAAGSIAAPAPINPAGGVAPQGAPQA
jgi:biopolymer transport protein TolQ